MGELAAGTLFAGYRIAAVAGRGGMGIVYRATETALGRTVALKLLSPGRAEDAATRERFLRESRLAASIDHPNVIPIYAAGEADGTAYISMRFVPGVDLRALVREEGALAPERAAGIVVQLAAALDAAHAAGLVHRDVKPANVLLGAGDHVYLTDFGLTKPLSGRGLTGSGQWVGTPQFAAPEQIRGLAVDARTDVYALGCVLFFALTGRSPLEREGVEATVWAHLNVPAPRLTDVAPGLPAELDDVVERALAKEPSERYAHAGDLALALTAALSEPSSTVTSPALEPARAAGRLPAPPTALFGREDELARLVELAGGPARLVTLVGPGGVGKTRLAIEAARRIGSGATRFVALTSVSDPADLASAIAVALAAPRREGEPPKEALLRFLGEKEILLVLDNFEHLMGGAPLLGELLAECPRLALLVTSREPTRLAAEQLVTVRPLAVPSAGAPAAGLLRNDAVALFCDRVRARDADFVLDARTGPHVQEICRRLDGLPLALELAAARVGILTAEQLAERLGGALTALGTGPSDAPARHRTLRATIDWSFDLLSEPERRAFARMAVFAGGATAAAAEVVTGAPLDTLESLAAKQLLVHRDGRLSMLGTIREYALERLAEDPETGLVEQRLVAWFVAFAREATPHLLQADRPTWLARLAAELPNAWVALSRALKREQAEAALALVGELGEYWWHANHWDEGLDWIDAALDLGAEAPPRLRAQALLYRARLTDHRRSPRWHADLETALELFRECEDASGIAACLGHIAFAERWVDHRERAAELVGEAVAIAREAGDPRVIAQSLTHSVLAADGYEEAAARAGPAAAFMREHGDLLHLAEVCSATGYIAVAAGRYREAVPWLEEALAAARRNGNAEGVFYAAGNLGLAKLFLDELDDAAGAVAEALAATSAAAMEHQADETLLGAAAVAARAGRSEDAARLAGAAERLTGGSRRSDEEVVWRRLAALLAQARHESGEATWDRAHRAGTALSARQAIDLVLGTFTGPGG